MQPRDETAVLWPYLPRLVTDWLATDPERTHRAVAGTLLFADISGFTRLTHRLARHGPVGAEEMSDALNATFGELLGLAAEDGADLVKWGGDAVLLLFQGRQHAARACHAAHRMRARIREIGTLHTTAGRATLRMSQAVHSARFDFFLVGDPALHRELFLCGPAVDVLIALEAAAHAGHIAVSGSTAALLQGTVLGGPVGGDGRLLLRSPETPAYSRIVAQRTAIDACAALPGPIREHLLLGAGEPEHRAVAVGFVRFSGVNALLRSGSTGQAAAALDELVRHVSQVAGEYDVTFAESDIHSDGGKVLLVAGAPASCGHDAERLLRAARLIVDGAGRLPVHIGAAHGRVFCGDFGPTSRRTYSVKGDAVNLAARLCGRAHPGQVLVTHPLTAHSDTLFETVRPAAFTAKGKPAPVQALELGQIRGERTTHPTPGGLLVGRRHEMAVLDDGLEHALHRRGRLVQILGEPGIGKSRLLAELVEQARDELQVFSLRCDEYESSTPYHPFRALFRDLLGISSGAPAGAVAERLTARCTANAPHLLPWLPLLATVLDLPMGQTPETSGLSEEFRKRRLEETVVALLHQMLVTPTLLTLDDLQHMDGASADLLTALAGQVADEPWLVVVGGRDQPGGWQPPEDADAAVLRLPPLSDEQSIHLLQAATEARPLPRQTIAALAARAEGNPLFLEALINATDASGRVEDLPATVEDLVTAQIDRLAPPDRLVLRYASVLGMGFDSDDLAALVDGHAPPPDAATVARLSEFVEPGAGPALRFRHALMRDVAYAGLPFRARWALHEQVGLALERTAIDDGRCPELLSFHFFHARRFDKAWEYSVRAGGLAVGKYANQEAADLLTRALEAERRGPAGMVSVGELGRVLELLGDTWFTIGLTDNAVLAYRRGRRELRHDPVQSARLVAKEARVDQRVRKLPQSLRRLTRALHGLDGATGRDAQAARSVLAMRYAISRFSQGHVTDALRWGERAAKHAEEAVDKPSLARAYGTLHGIYVASGRKPSLPYGELALQAYTELGDLPGQADCANNIAVEALEDNQWVEAAEAFDRAAQTYRRIGDTAGEGNALFNQADVLVRQGHLEVARELLGDALTIARAVSDDELVALVLRETGRACCRLGDFDAGLTHLEQARAIFARIGEPDELPATDLALAEAHLLRGDVDASLLLTDELRAALDDASPLQPALRRTRGFAWLAHGRRDRAAEEFRAGVAGSVAHDNRYGHALNSLGLARALAGGTDGDDEAARGRLAELGVVRLPLPEATPAGV